MARPRVIDRDAVLDAAERVAVRDGPARLTLDAVAAEAGIAKASVIYDYKCKQALIEAMIARRMAAEDARIAAAAEAVGDGPDRAIRGRILAAARAVPEEERGVALALTASLAQDAALRRPVQDSYRRRIAQILAESRSPRGALLAFLAVEGLMALEWLALHGWAPEERERLLAEIAWLAEQEPVPAGRPDPSGCA